MKQITYKCDICGCEGEDGFYRAYISEMGETNPETYELNKELSDTHWCNDCISTVVDVINSIGCAEPEPEPEPEEKKVPRQNIDMGKVVALRNAGWSFKAIAEEIGSSQATVCKRFNRLLDEATSLINADNNNAYIAAKLRIGEDAVEMLRNM